MKKYTIFSLLFLALSIGCNKPSDFGKELISGSNIPFFTADTFNLQASSVEGDSVRIYVRGLGDLTATSFLVGSVNDPYFGMTEAELYTQFQMSSSYSNNLSSVVIDSIIWDVYYDADSTHQYGDLTGKFNLEVRRINEDMNVLDTLYANRKISTDPLLMASLSDYQAMPFREDSSHLRFVMNDNFANFLKSLPDSTFSNSAKLQEQFEGLSIGNNGNVGGMLSLNLVDNRNQLKIYFKEQGSATQDSIRMITTTNSVRHTHFKHDRTGSRYANYLADPSSDSVLFVQAMGGPQIKITLPPMDYLKGSAVNFAELQLTIAPDNGFLFRKPRQIWLFKKNTAGTTLTIKDGLLALNNSLFSSFGGQPEEFVENGQTVYRYKIRFPLHLIDYIDGLESNELYISVLYGGYAPSRAIFNGPTTKVNPLKLKLIVTHLL